MHEIGPLTYRQGHVVVWAENFECRDDALMHDRVIVGVYTGTQSTRASSCSGRGWTPRNFPRS
ncbi:hypothetical protein ACFQ2B_00225 [Streptomyces stramineus]